MDFVLQVEPRDGQWYLAVLDSPLGQRRATTAQPFAQPQEALSRSPTEAGVVLWEALFPPPIAELWRRSRDAARQREVPLRLVVRTSAALAEWPWELLRDPESDFLALSAQTPLVRYVELAEPTPTTLLATLPFRLLLVSASPLDLPPLRDGREIGAIEQALAPLVATGQLQHTILREATAERLQVALRRLKPHAIHLIAHGSPAAQLCLEDEQRLTAPLEAAHLRRLLADQPTLRFAWLNSCHGATAALGGSMAHALVEAGLPAVLAMQRAFDDRAARLLAATLYSALLSGVRLEQALSEGRKALARADADAWATPALFLRAASGHLWSWAPRPSQPESPKAVPPPPHPAILQRGQPPDTSRVERRQGRDGVPMVRVAGGAYWVGPPGGERLVQVAPFWLDETPVTNQSYAHFVAATRNPPPPLWRGPTPPRGQESYPVVGVSWHEATRYAAWAGKRLPSAVEWEAAARGGDGRAWPWGPSWSPASANTQESGWQGPSPVDRHPLGQAPCGALDLAGNVWEWLTDDDPEGGKCLKGGSFQDDAEAAAAWSTAAADPARGFPDVGFRCAADDPAR